MANPISLSSSGSRSRQNVWDPQIPYLQDVYSQGSNIYHNPGAYGYSGTMPGMQAGGAGGFQQNPTNSAMMPGGAAPPGQRGTTTAPPPAPAPVSPVAPVANANQSQIDELQLRLNRLSPESHEYGPLQQQITALQQSQPAAPTEPQSPAPGIPPGGPNAPPLPPWMEQGMEGSSQAFDSLVNATDPGNNPYFGGAVNAALRPLFEQYVNQFMPANLSGAAAAGQGRNDPRQQLERGLAQQGLAHAAGDVVSRMGSNAYGQGLSAAADALRLNPYGATPWDELGRYRENIGPPVPETSSRTRTNSIGL